MAISPHAHTELRTEVTPPSTIDVKPDVPAAQSTESQKNQHCSSKLCVRKMSSSTHGKCKKVQESSSSESEDTSSDESSSESSDDTSESEIDRIGAAKSRRKSKSKRSKRNSKLRKSKSKPKSAAKDKSSTKVSKTDTEVPSNEVSEKNNKDATTDTSVDAIESLKSHLVTQGFDMSNKHNSASMKLFLHTLSKSDKGESDDSSSSAEASSKEEEKRSRKHTKKAKRASKADFKRIDEVWDNETYSYKLKETSNEKKTDEFDEFIFTIRRKFDSDGHYEETVVDIKSQPLKQCLQTILADVEGISLVEDTPSLEPNMLFLFLEDMRARLAVLRTERKEAVKHKARRLAAVKLKHLAKLIEYLDEDFDGTKKSLYPLLENGRITFDYLWALYKPNTIAYSPTYGDEDTPRAFRIESVYKHKSLARGVYYEIEGKYFDFDGKSFGTSAYCVQVYAFQGTRRITSLGCYPLQYHPDSQNIKPKLVERGKQFLCLAGQNYRYYRGMAYVKKNDRVLKASVDGRIMVDPGTFRRINPNYCMQEVEARTLEPDEEKVCVCENPDAKDKLTSTSGSGRTFRLVKSGDSDAKVVEQGDINEHVDESGEGSDYRDLFTEDELLLASPVLFGFCFSEKTWLEFNVATISDVQWNDGAFESLVLPEQHKSIVKALVSAHGKHSARGFDDIIAGKGKGLVAVLHGRPGLGKTLTCEAVSDLLKRPLYTVSAGDLGTGATHLEEELQSILDIAHTWNAVLLLDEADVFLEERSIHDVHRNALVSIFLRLLEYFQGILFLTTNRVETFDAAFVSRIHLSLRYGELSLEAKKSVWKTFIDKVKQMDGLEAQVFTDKDLTSLARHDMNGRQIKNLVKTAQALALHEGAPMGMNHIRHVIEVARSFELDLKGGSGYSDAMRSYT